MIKLDIQVFKACYDYCETIGRGFGYGALEGFYINAIVIFGTVLVAISKIGVNRKC